MKKSSLISKIQSAFGVTKSEVFFVALILSGLIIGSIVKNFSKEDSELSTKPSEEVYALLDSVAEAQKTSNIGTDMGGSSYPELASGDTVIQKETFYPTAKAPKKEILQNSKININQASRVELMKLPGIGEATANKIIEFRKIQPFKTIEDIMNIKGIGIKKFEKMKEFIEV